MVNNNPLPPKHTQDESSTQSQHTTAGGFRRNRRVQAIAALSRCVDLGLKVRDPWKYSHIVSTHALYCVKSTELAVISSVVVLDLDVFRKSAQNEFD
jgi:hypothetical protein